jgi:hypothetical protein
MPLSRLAKRAAYGRVRTSIHPPTHKPKEEIMGAEGIDKCVLDDPGDVVCNCEIVIQLP